METDDLHGAIIVEKAFATQLKCNKCANCFVSLFFFALLLFAKLKTMVSILYYNDLTELGRKKRLVIDID